MAGGKAKISSKSKSHPTKGKGFGNFVYDSENGTVFGRTAASWFKITVFYIIFYACLAGFFCLNYYIFSRTLNEHSPRWQLAESLIGANPGIGYRPMPDQETNDQSTLIWYNSKKPDDAKFWWSQLEEIVNKTHIPDAGSNVKICSETSRSTKSVACIVNTNTGGCTVENKFGYPEGQPCVLIKLNKIFGWEPEPFGMKDGKYDAIQLKEDLDDQVANNQMPPKLQDKINNALAGSRGNEESVLKAVWFSCQGENVGDQESLPDTEIEILPSSSIPGYYFPYSNQPFYRSPFVMAKLRVPQTSRHVLINIECRGWAKNIKYDRISRLGSVHFELMID